MGTQCAAHTHREMVPHEVHHVWPKGDGGPNIEANRVLLCSNAHGSVHALIDLHREFAGEGRVPYVLRRQFGRKVQALADLGWSRIVSQTMG